ncbi:unnamed protein product, partial [Prorocentrum cordatum]
KDPSGHWHWISSSTTRPWSKQPWTCKGCGTTNVTKNACSTCGMHRTYSDVAAAPNALPPSSPSAPKAPNNPVRAKLEEVAAALSAATTPVQRDPPAPAPCNGADRETAKQTLRDLETALKALPDVQCLQEERMTLQAKISQQKAILRGPEPVGARLDNAMAALGRAQQRNAECKTALQLAQEAMEVSNSEITRLNQEVASLKAEFAEEGHHASKRGHSPSPTETLKETSGHLEKLLAMLSSGAALPKEHVEQAKAYSDQLLRGFQTCIATMEAQENQALPEVRRRCNGKQPIPVVPVSPPDPNLYEFKPVRHVGKQPVLTRPRNIFDPYGISSGGPAAGSVSAALLLSKVQSLEYQFNEVPVDLIGIQEGRSPSTVEKVGCFYKMLASAADEHGGLGVQLWIRIDTCIQVLTWQAVSPRLLYAVLRRKDATCFTIVAHAPIEHVADDVRCDWWDSLTNLTRTLLVKYSGMDYAVLVDANARIGSIPGVGIGPVCSQVENRNGQRLRTYLQTFALAAVNSFFDDASMTWRSTRGLWSRIDYILVPLHALPAVSWCQTLDSIALAFSLEIDHVAVGARVTLLSRSPSSTATSSTVPFALNKSMLQCGARRAWFRDELWAVVARSYNFAFLDVDSHLDAVNDAVRAAASRAFGGPRDQPRNQWISWEAWAYIRQVAPLRRARSPGLRAIFRHRLAMGLYAWRYAVSTTKLCATILNVQRRARPLLQRDRQHFLDNLVLKADRAMDNADFRTAYAVVRSLSGSCTRASPVVQQLDGSLATDPEAVNARWTEHYAAVCNGQVTDTVSLKQAPVSSDLLTAAELDVGPAATQSSFARLGRNKGVGRDRIPAELLVAGDAPLAILYSAINERVRDEGAWPVSWRGGRFQSVFKKKGSPTMCDDHRGIFLADHCAKGLTSIIKEAIDPGYSAHVPKSQYGAVAKRGTDYASLVVRLMISYATHARKSIFVLFLDLVNAFDKAIRQLVCGFGPNPPADTTAALRDLGVSERAAAWISSYLREHGPVLLGWGANAKAVEMAQSLHEGPQAVVLIADTPAELDESIDVLLDVLVELFDSLHLELNWNPGKSECLLKYRGRDLKAMNSCCMRGLRRIAGALRFSSDCNIADRQ